MSGRQISNLDRLLRMRNAGAAGEGIAPPDAQHLAAWVDTAVAKGIGIDAAAGLADGWQLKARQRLGKLFGLGTGASFRTAARELRADLARYIGSDRFEGHLASPIKPTEGRDALLYPLALRYFRGGTLASEETIRKDMATEAGS